MEAWAKARAEDDYASFRPWLDRTLELKHRYIACFPATDDPYDVLLDDFERGMRTDEVRTSSTGSSRRCASSSPRRRTTRRSRSWTARTPARRSTRSRSRSHAPLARARTFRLDPTVHPFCMSLSTRDIRLTTRYAEDDLHGNSLFSTMHEVGHGLYEHGGDAALDRTPLATGCSSALHESQSRLWENVIGRSLPFWRWFYPQFRGGFANVLADVSLERFHRAINRAQPSLIRVDADETTYGLHIILRFELEQELLSGTLSTADLPDAWNAKLEELLGIAPPSDRLGCLQDVHWSGGMFGYFPTYQLGNVLSVQIWERAPRRAARCVRADRAGLVRGDLRVAPRAALPSRAKVHAGRDDRARGGRPDRPRAVPPLSRGEERHARRLPERRQRAAGRVLRGTT